MLMVAMITRNEENAVGPVIRRLKSLVPDAEILIVDSSEDQTAAIAEREGARVIRQYPPQGYGAAMELALRSATSEAVVTLDCDGTYPEEYVPQLARYILEDGYDVVDASRLESKPAAMPWPNYAGNRFFAVLASKLFHHGITDLHSGMRAYRRGLLDDLAFDYKSPALPVELLLRPLKAGRRIKTVFIPYKERIGTSKMRPLSGAWWTMRRILACRLT